MSELDGRAPALTSSRGSGVHQEVMDHRRFRPTLQLHPSPSSGEGTFKMIPCALKRSHLPIRTIGENAGGFKSHTQLPCHSCLLIAPVSGVVPCVKMAWCLKLRHWRAYRCGCRTSPLRRSSDPLTCPVGASFDEQCSLYRRQGCVGQSRDEKACQFLGLRILRSTGFLRAAVPGILAGFRISE